ncbi:DGQHR domain-containing protein [Pseudanabaena sp. BC1403]|uniref:DGQHR domain-containing protein n=1 Tax=Pseudanabaena sp. BC1403 TaxID=2043171 RepID=UPI000CD814F1|nr:DGQHR domain-containing protein [Pseudanabaena sp. BC1403]
MNIAQYKEETKSRFTHNLVTQGINRFYTLTLPSDILAKICFVTTREEDPEKGFQRVLDKKRAQEIADYIDSGASIPNSIVLSAQPDAELEEIQKGKIITFFERPKSFLVLDGQHRVYGFSLAKMKLRVPVVIYNNLSRQEESRLFIDINTKQRPVPNELLLDIKKLAERETDSEQLLREIFDLFYNSPDSPLVGLLSPSEKTKEKLTRVTFNQAFKPLIDISQDKEVNEIYEITRDYIQAFISGMNTLDTERTIVKPIVFRAVMLLFSQVGQRVKDRYGTHYSVSNFYEVLKPIFIKTKATSFTQAKSINSLHKKMSDLLFDFTF